MDRCDKTGVVGTSGDIHRMDSFMGSLPKRRRGRPRLSDNEAAKRLTLQKKKRLALKIKGGAAYEDALKKDSLRKRLKPFLAAAKGGSAFCQYDLGCKYEEEKSSLVYTPHKQRGITRIDFGSGLV